VAGPLARHASDLALALEVIAGPDEEHEGIGYRLALPPPRHDDLKNFRVLVIDTHPLMRAVGDRTIGAAPGKIGNQGYADERRGEFSPNGVAIWIFGSGRGKGSPIPGLRRQRRSGARRSGPRKGQQSIDDRGLAPSLQRQPPLGFTKFSRRRIPVTKQVNRYRPTTPDAGDAPSQRMNIAGLLLTIPLGQLMKQVAAAAAIRARFVTKPASTGSSLRL
jgi:hypothetical protein